MKTTFYLLIWLDLCKSYHQSMVENAAMHVKLYEKKKWKQISFNSTNGKNLFQFHKITNLNCSKAVHTAFCI